MIRVVVVAGVAEVIISIVALESFLYLTNSFGD